MKRTLSLLAAAAALSAALAVGQGADAQVQRGAGNLAPQQKDDPGFPPPPPQPTKPAMPGGFKGQPTQCMPGYSQLELKFDAFGQLSRMTCQSPVIECPEPAQGYTVGLELAKQVVNADDGRFRIQYRCLYYRLQG